MVKYIISFGDNIFSMSIAPIKDKKGQYDWKKMFNHIKSIVGTDATVELVGA